MVEESPIRYREYIYSKKEIVFMDAPDQVKQMIENMKQCFVGYNSDNTGIFKIEVTAYDTFISITFWGTKDMVFTGIERYTVGRDVFKRLSLTWTQMFEKDYELKFTYTRPRNERRADLA